MMLASWNSGSSNSDSSSDSDSDNEKNNKGPLPVIQTKVDVHYSKDGEQQERNVARDDGESDPEATHGGNDPDNVAADSGAQAKAIPVVTVSKPSPGSIAPLLEKSRTNMEIKGVSLNKPQVYEAAAFLEQIGSLSTINVVNCGIDDDDVQKLKEALKVSPSNPVLLNLSLNPLTSNCIDHILDLLEAKPSIEAVLLQGTRVGDGGVKRLVSGILTQHDIRKSQGPEYSEKGVHELDLSDCKMGDEGAFEVARLLTSDLDLDTLTLSYNHAVSEEGWAAIGRALSENQHIETLTLDHNFIGDEGIEVISRGLFNNQSLTALDINDVGLAERGGKCLMELLKRNTIILEITLMENKLSETQVEDIQRYVALNKAAYNQES